MRATTPPQSTGPLLSVTDLQVQLPTGRRSFVDAVRGVSFEIARGERVGIVGESGSGKSVTGRAIAGLLPTSPRVQVTGSIRFDGEELVGARASAWDAVRRRQVGMIFQDPLTYLNPVMRVGPQVAEASGARGRAALEAASRWLVRAGLDDPDIGRRFPHELSGGMRQRVLIAIALAKEPELIIADEPTTALDATVQRRVLVTLDECVRDLGTSLALISHDLAVVAERTDRVVVMYAGRIVESGPTAQILTSPRHPYTQALVASVTSLSSPGPELYTITAQQRASWTEEGSA
jgi:ABC-type dipeptide/oligopeptide/nickel transport system ATPase component